MLDPFVRLHAIDENAAGEVAPLLGVLRSLHLPQITHPVGQPKAVTRSHLPVGVRRRHSVIYDQPAI
jgi:hypothetical protein